MSDPYGAKVKEIDALRLSRQRQDSIVDPYAAKVRALDYSMESGVPYEVLEEREKRKKILAGFGFQDWTPHPIMGSVLGNMAAPGSPLFAVADLALGAGRDMKSVIDDPNKSLTGVAWEGSKKGITELFNTGKALFNPETTAETVLGLGRGVLWEGLARPFIVSPLQLMAADIGIGSLTQEEKEEKAREVALNFMAVGVGATVARSLNLATNVGKASKMLEGAAKIAGGVDNLSDDVLTAARTLASSPQWKDKVLRGTAGFVAGGAPMGFFAGETPEDRFANALNYGLASATIGALAGGAYALVKGAKPAGSNVVTDKVDAINRDRSLQALFNEVPNATVDIAEHYKPEDITKVISKNIKDGETMIVSGLPRELKYNDVEGTIPTERTKPGQGSTAAEHLINEVIKLDTEDPIALAKKMGSGFSTNLTDAYSKLHKKIIAFKKKLTVDPSERIISAAARVGDNVFTDVAHIPAKKRAKEVTGKSVEGFAGFWTNKGRYVDPIEAGEIAARNGQVDPKLISADVNYMLSSHDFSGVGFESVKPGRHYIGQTIVTEGTLTSSVIYHRKKSGEVIAMVSRESNAAKKAQFKQTGFYEGMIVERAGKEYIVDGVTKDGKVRLRDPVTGKKVKASEAADVSHSAKMQNKTGAQAAMSTDPDFAVHQAVADQLRDTSVKDLNNKLSNKGYVAKSDGSGIKIYGKDGTLVQAFNDVPSVHSWIDQQVGRVGGVDIGIITHSPVDQSTLPVMEHVKPNWLHKMMYTIDRTTAQSKFLTMTAPTWYHAIKTIAQDTNTGVLRIWEDFQVALRKGTTLRNEVIAPAIDVMNRINALFTPDERSTVVPAYFETDSYINKAGVDPKRRVRRDRDASKTEIQAVDQLSRMMIDEDGFMKVLQPFKAALEEWRVTNKPLSALVGEYAKANKLVPEQVDALNHLASLFDTYEAGDPNLNLFSTVSGQGELSLATVIDLTQAKLSNALSREDFAKANKFTPEKVAALEELRTWLDATGHRFGYAPSQQLNHAYPRFVQHVQEKIGEKATRNLRDVSELLEHAVDRGARPDLLVRDLNNVVTSFVNNGVRRSGVQVAARNFQARAHEAIQEAGQKLLDLKNTDPKSRVNPNATVAAYQSMIDDHIKAAMHVISPEDQVGISATLEVASALNIAPDQTARTAVENFSRRLTAMSTFAAMGINPMQGVRDAVTFMSTYFVRLGARATMDMIKMANAAAHNAEILHKAGLVPTELKSQFAESVNEISPGFKGRVYQTASAMAERVGEAGFNMSLQRQAYEFFHRGAYTERWKAVSEAIKKFEQHKNLKQFEKAVQLDSYDPAISNEFRNIMNSNTQNRYEMAADFLAKTTAWEMLGVYGLANHPVGFNTVVGRFAGQFGQWPLWALRTMGYGTANALKDPKMAGRWAAYTGALVGAGALTGINFSQWMMTPWNATFNGGPQAQVLEAMKMAVGGTGMDQEFYLQKLKYLVYPFNFDNNAPVPVPFIRRNIFVPIPFALWNATDALGITATLGENSAQTLQDNPLLMGARMAGFSVTPWDEFGISKAVFDAPINRIVQDVPDY